ncbi:MAG: GNAT family N-acetyltransferase [Dehalococcoidia bacterium]
MTTTQASIRQATAEDAAGVSSVLERVVAEPNPVGFTTALSAEQVAAWLRRLGDQGCIFVAEAEGRTVGFGALDFNTESPDTGTLGVWILPDWRRRGIATQLGGCVIDFAREAGYRRIRGRLPANNEPALSFLSGLGALVPMQNPEMTFELPL